MGSASKRTNYLVSMKKGNKCRDLKTFSKSIKALVVGATFEVKEDDKCFTTILSSTPNIIKTLKKEGFRVQEIK